MNRKLLISLAVTGALAAPVLLSPMPRFRQPLSTVVEAYDGTLIGARIAGDGQWRFPAGDSLPIKYSEAVTEFEDRWFYYHPGVNPVSLARALFGNIKAGKIVSGGSTITMQVARLSRGNRERTYGAKLAEILMALKLEIFASKEKILSLYAANAPFGGNTVGIEAASQRYFHTNPSQLSWAGAALLAVLPNSPSLAFPGRNQELLKAKRDRVLLSLYNKGCFDSLTYTLSLDEPLPGAPGQVPALAPHLTDYFSVKQPGGRIRTTIDPHLQEYVTGVINANQQKLAENKIFNSACMVTEVETGNVIAYVGNSTLPNSVQHNGNVDLIRAERSTGSILKPLLYAAMQQAGILLPNSLVSDVPVRFQGFSPENFDKSYSGAVPASAALAQSLNIPSVNMLRTFTPEKFLMLLRSIGFTSFRKEAGYYGLSLILGGGETSLWELSGVYSSMARTLNRYNRSNIYMSGDFRMPSLVSADSASRGDTVQYISPLSASSVWLTLEALEKVNRPEAEAGWQFFSSSGNLAWKTGTSFGFRDAWAVGTTPEYVIAVWAGNADGEGRPGLTGLNSAAPVLFEVFSRLKSEIRFAMPAAEMTTVSVCRSSGMRAGPDCKDTEEIWACTEGLRSDPCPYHKIVHLDKTGTRRVNADCYPAAEIRNESWFVLTPAMEFFYKFRNSEYRTLPPVMPGCRDEASFVQLEFMYPLPGSRIFIPRDQVGEQTRVIAEVAHRDASATLFWSLDKDFIGKTRFIHKMTFTAQPGKHAVTVADNKGNIIRCGFSVTGSLAAEKE